MDASCDDVLAFWFPDGLAEDASTLLRRAEWWFRGGADDEIIRRFSRVLELAERGDLDDWAAEARSRLALIIVLDQFSRSIYRGSGRAFSNDPRALSLALEGLASGQYAALERPWEKTFFVLPLGHSEQLEHLERVVELSQDLVREAREDLRTWFEFSASQARGTATSSLGLAGTRIGMKHQGASRRRRNWPIWRVASSSTPGRSRGSRW